MALCVYVLSIEENPNRIKIGKTGDFETRLYNLNNTPGVTHRKLRQYFVDTPREMENLESRLHLLYSASRVPHSSNKEYYDVGRKEISMIRSSGDYLFKKLAAAEKNAPQSIADCIRLGLVVLNASVYQNYCQRNGRRGLGSEVFEAEMKRLQCVVPGEAVKVNPSLGQAAWTGYVKILPSSSGAVSKLVVKELKAINRLKRRGRISKVEPPKRDGSVLTISCEAFRRLAPLVWASGS